MTEFRWKWLGSGWVHMEGSGWLYKMVVIWLSLDGSGWGVVGCIYEGKWMDVYNGKNIAEFRWKWLGACMEGVDGCIKW